MSFWTPTVLDKYEYTKYQTRNPFVLKLINGFYKKINLIVRDLNCQSILDAGCGDGEALIRLKRCLPDNVAAFDINKGRIDDARNRLPDVKIETQDIYQLPYDDNSFDLILCLEVLEHLKNPSSALKEIARVTSKYLIVSVPSEPFFMLGNLMRGKNILQCGNDQAHVNHWNKKTIRKFLSKEVNVNKITTSFPWLIVLCSK